MEAGTEMPAIPGETIGMKRPNCMAYCFKKHKDYKYFGESREHAQGTGNPYPAHILYVYIYICARVISEQGCAEFFARV